MSRDTNLVQDYLHDPLVHDRISLSLASSLVDCGALILQKAVNLQIPIFIAHGQKDSIVDSSGSVELHKRVSSKNKRLAVYSGLCHEIHNRTASRAPKTPARFERMDFRAYSVKPRACGILLGLFVVLKILFA